MTIALATRIQAGTKTIGPKELCPKASPLLKFEVGSEDRDATVWLPRGSCRLIAECDPDSLGC